MSKIIKDKHIGEATLSKKPTQGISLVINEGAVTTDKIADKAVTPEKLSDSVKEELVDPSIQDLQNQIDSIQTTGIALSGELGDNTHIGIHQQKITETVNDLDSRIISAGDKADEALMLARSISETPAVNKVFVGSDNNEGMLEPEAGTVTWPTPIRQIIYITHWRKEEASWQGEEGEYWYDPTENMLYLFVTEGNHTYTIDVTLHPESLYIYNNEGYRYDVTSNTLVKVLNSASGSNTSGKIFPVVALTQNIDTDPIDYTKVNIGDYLFIEDYVAKYIGNGAIDTNIEDGTFFVWKEDLFMSTQGGYLSTMIDHYVVTNDIINRAVTTDKIADKAITTTKIADKAITKDQIADMTIEGSNIRHATITGHHIASGTIDGEHIVSKSITGNNIADQTITGDKLVNGTITNNKIQAGSIGEQEIAEGGVKGYNIGEEEITAFHLSSGCVGADALGDGVIYSTHIVDGEITTNKIKNLGVTTNKIANGAVDANKLATNSVTTAKVANGAITDTKLASKYIKGIRVNGGDPYFPGDDRIVNLNIDSGGGVSPIGPSIPEGFDEIPTNPEEPTVLYSYLLEEDEKYLVSKEYTVDGGLLEFPPNVQLLFNGGKITGNAVLVGNGTKIIDTTEQIFGEDVAIDNQGTWNIEFARPEWFGAKSDDVDYGSWPLRIYGATVNNVTDSGTLNDNSNYPHDPDIFFSTASKPVIDSQTHQPTGEYYIVYEKIHDLGLAPDSIAFNVVYDTSNKCFLYEYSEGGNTYYYSKWHNSEEWNDYSGEYVRARRDCVFISSSEVNGRTFGSTTGIQTAAHIFKYNSDNELLPSFIDLITYNDCRIPFQRALIMGRGNIQLQKDGVYTFRSAAINGEGEYACIDFNNLLYDGTFEGNGATLFFLPQEIKVGNVVVDFNGFYINGSPSNNTKYTIQNLKCTTIRGFKVEDNENYIHIDCTTSNCKLFQIQRGFDVNIKNIETMYMHEDFYTTANGLNNPLPAGRGIVIKNWKSRESSQPLYCGWGMQKLVIEDSDITNRRYGQAGHHMFYINFGGTSVRDHILCKNTKVVIPDGFTSCVFDLTTIAEGSSFNYARLQNTIKFIDCDVIGHSFGTVNRGVTLICENLKFYATDDTVVSKDLTILDDRSIFNKTVNAPAAFEFTDCFFECGSAPFFRNNSNSNYGQDILTMRNCRVSGSFGESSYTNKSGKDLSSSVIVTRGYISVKNCAFETPYAPVISMGGGIGDDYILGAKGKCRKFEFENNTANCAGYFFYATDVNNTVGSTIINNRIHIAHTRIKIRGNSYYWMAALATCFYNNDSESATYTVSDLDNVSIAYNTIVTNANELPSTGMSSTTQKATSITTRIVNSNYTLFKGNTVDGVVKGPEDEQL